MRWVGIDEAGYGPNLGPLVMTAVVAESCRENGRAYRAVPKPRLLGRPGRDGRSRRRRSRAALGRRLEGDLLWREGSKRLEAACLAAIHAASNTLPRSLRGLDRGCWGRHARRRRAHALARIEPERVSPGRPIAHEPELEALLERKPLCAGCGAWQVAGVRAVVVGPARFNARLFDHGLKSAVHYEAFEKLLSWVWCLTIEGSTTRVVGDKHGGRHYYYSR